VQSVAVCYSVLQCVAVCYSVLQCVAAAGQRGANLRLASHRYLYGCVCLRVCACVCVCVCV